MSLDSSDTVLLGEDGPLLVRTSPGGKVLFVVDVVVEVITIYDENSDFGVAKALAWGSRSGKKLSDVESMLR